MIYMRGGLVVGLAFLFTQGCSSSYEPARSPRIVMVVDSGYPTFVKDGERVGSPAFGTGLVQAVHGNPRAEHHARVGRNLVVGGFVLDMLGLGAEIGGLVVLGQQNAGAPEQHSTAGTVLVVSGITAIVAGTVMILTGQPHIYDAVNLYNDGLEAPLTTAPEAKRPH